MVERLLGKGGFGEVWKANHPHLSSMPPVALKFCLDLDDRSRELLRHEADMVLRAQREIRSDGIVPLLHAYLNNDPPCLEFPYIEGGTLVRLFDECREKAGSFSPLQAQRIVQRIAQIVAPAHRAAPRLIHRDLKPSNVLVERRTDGRIVLRVTDFGIGAIAAQPVLDRSRSTSSLEGNLSSVLTGAYSPLYASPQQMQGDKPDPRDDVYALGVIWYQLLKGDLASPAPTGRRWMEVLRGRGMSDAAIDLLSSCFESDPAYRPADAGMLADQIQTLAPSVSPPVLTADSKPPSVKADSPAPAPIDPEYITTRTGQIKLKRIPAGTFRMGSADGEGSEDKHPQHEVRISRPFYLGVYEVTQAQYEAVMGQNPSYFARTGEGKGTVAGQSTDQHPVENVTWLDAVKFCNALSEKEGLPPFYEINGKTVQVPDWSGSGYRLPTEAEWEYACRARDDDAVFVRRRRERTGSACLVRREFWQQDASRR